MDEIEGMSEEGEESLDKDEAEMGEETAGEETKEDEY